MFLLKMKSFLAIFLWPISKFRIKFTPNWTEIEAASRSCFYLWFFQHVYTLGSRLKKVHPLSSTPAQSISFTPLLSDVCFVSEAQKIWRTPQCRTFCPFLCVCASSRILMRSYPDSDRSNLMLHRKLREKYFQNFNVIF